MDVPSLMCLSCSLSCFFSTLFGGKNAIMIEFIRRHIIKRSKSNIKPINNRWVWGRCLKKHKGRSFKVTMTTLRAAPTRYCHTENHSGKRGKYLPKQHPERWEGWGQKTTITSARKSNVNKMKQDKPQYRPTYD